MLRRALALCVLLLMTAAAPAAAQAPSSPCPTPNTSNVTSSCPTISGSVQEARFLTGSAGTWTGTEPIAIGFQWQRCATTNESTCADIPGENEAQYLVSTADVGGRLRVVVTAGNADGSAIRTSTVSASVAPASGQYPGSFQTSGVSLEALAPAAISSPLVGDTLRIADGTGQPPASDGWFNPPASSLTYAWRRCAGDGSLTTCRTIPGATERTYTLVPADANHSIRARLTGTNQSGSKALLSAATAAVGIPDRDGDGVPSDRDCNDANPAIRPGAPDSAGNGVDEDCSGADASASPGSTPSPLPRLRAQVLAKWRSVRGHTLVVSMVVKRLPAGAAIEVRCAGDGCPIRQRSLRPKGTSADLGALFRKARLEPRTTIEIRITAAGMIGEVVRQTMRRDKAPSSTTLCLPPGASRPQRC